MEIGEKLKVLRKQKSITLKRLSEETGLSIGFLSNIERGSTSPTVKHLEVIAKVLCVPLSRLFVEPPGVNVVRKSERKIVYDVPGRARWESLVDRNKPVAGICTTLYPHSDLMVSGGHPFPEVCIVLSGSLHVSLAGTEYDLNEGDTLFVPPSVSHTALNLKNEECTCYWISFPNTV